MTATREGETEQPVTLTPNNGVYSLTLDASDYLISATVDIEWAGSGTETDPYIINSVGQMNILSARAAAGNTFEDKYFVLRADLTYNKETENNFTPIKKFSGIFDGEGHTISGINVSTSGDYYNGLFAELYAGTVKNLTLKNSTFSGANAAGAIAGNIAASPYMTASKVSITNCFVDADVLVSASAESIAGAGGIVGNIGDGITMYVTGNVSKAKVSATAKRAYAGGVVGYKGTNRNGRVYDNLYLGDASYLTSTSTATGEESGITKTGAIFGEMLSQYGETHSNFYTAEGFTINNKNEALAYVYDGVYTSATTPRTYNYTAGAGKEARNGFITAYDNNLLKYDGKFYSRYQKGDANGDGVVNITDYVTIVNKIHDSVSGSINHFAADANGDGVINITDAVKVVNTIHDKD